jgi:hypothetical protein
MPFGWLQLASFTAKLAKLAKAAKLASNYN